MRDSFIIYSDTYNAVKKLNDEQAGQLLHAIFQYQIEGDVPDLDPVVDMAFIFFKNHFDRDASKWADEIEKRRDAGRLGGLAKARNTKQKVANVASAKSATENLANLGDSVSVNVSDSVNVNEKKRAFAPPSLEEVSKYCLERSNGINPQEFIDHYEANGWFRGKTKIKDWKACARTWEAKDSAKVKTFKQMDHDTEKETIRNFLGR